MAFFIQLQKTKVLIEKFFARFAARRFHFLMIMLILASFTAAWLLIRPIPVIANAISPKEARLEAAPTPTPPYGSENRPRGTSPVIGILILLAPLAYLVWKSRGVKEPKITASCCLPVIDENKRPFKIEDDEPANRISGSG